MRFDQLAHKIDTFMKNEEMIKSMTHKLPKNNDKRPQLFSNEENNVSIFHDVDPGPEYAFQRIQSQIYNDAVQKLTINTP